MAFAYINWTTPVRVPSIQYVHVAPGSVREDMTCGVRAENSIQRGKPETKLERAARFRTVRDAPGSPLPILLRLPCLLMHVVYR